MATQSAGKSDPHDSRRLFVGLLGALIVAFLVVPPFLRLSRPDVVTVQFDGWETNMATGEISVLLRVRNEGFRAIFCQPMRPEVLGAERQWKTASVDAGISPVMIQAGTNHVFSIRSPVSGGALEWRVPFYQLAQPTRLERAIHWLRSTVRPGEPLAASPPEVVYSPVMHFGRAGE